MEQQLNTFFYADDDIDDLEFFKEVADEINQPVTLFEEGEKLLYALKNPPPKAAVVFLDLNMPVKSGFDILCEIKTSPSLSTTPIVIFTTSINPKDIELCKKLGANLYIKKPSSIDALRKAIKHVMSIDWDSFKPCDKQFVYQL